MTQQFTFDWPHGWQTRDGRDVVIYCTDAPGPYPIHGRIEGLSASISWNETGISCYGIGGIEGIGNLINRPAPIVSVPVDKLDDGTMLKSLTYGRTIVVPTEPGIECGGSRSIKWFYADELETSK